MENVGVSPNLKYADKIEKYNNYFSLLLISQNVQKCHRTKIIKFYLSDRKSFRFTCFVFVSLHFVINPHTDAICMLCNFLNHNGVNQYVASCHTYDTNSVNHFEPITCENVFLQYSPCNCIYVNDLDEHLNRLP